MTDEEMYKDRLLVKLRSCVRIHKDLPTVIFEKVSGKRRQELIEEALDEFYKEMRRRTL